MSIVATICARGGSQGLPNKNLRSLFGKPLIVHTIEQAQSCPEIEKIFVSTDSPKIAEVAKNAGANVPFLRPAELATHTAPKLLAVEHLVRYIINSGIKVSSIVDLDPTSPLRSIEDISDCISASRRHGTDVVITGYLADKNPYFNMVEKTTDGWARLVKTSGHPALRRQDAPVVYNMNGAIYVWRPETLKKGLFGGNTYLHVMPRERSIDIDSEIDFSLVELLMRKNKNKPRLYEPEYFSLKNQVIVVTGGAGLLGSRFARALAFHGASVAVADINHSKAGEIAEGISREIDGNVRGYPLNLPDRKSVARLRKQVEADMGVVTVLVNNAAAKSPGFYDEFEEYTLKDWQKVMDVNVMGAMVCAQEFGPVMADRGSGSIINIGSIYGLGGPDQRIYENSEYQECPINSPAVYSVSKAAIVGLTKFMATYWGQQSVRVNSLILGGVDSGQNEEFKRRYSTRVPLQRMAEKDEMCGPVVFLSSDASSYITGHDLVVDGGWTAW